MCMISPRSSPAFVGVSLQSRLCLPRRALLRDGLKPQVIVSLAFAVVVVHQIRREEDRTTPLAGFHIFHNRSLTFLIFTPITPQLWKLHIHPLRSTTKFSGVQIRPPFNCRMVPRLMMVFNSTTYFVVCRNNPTI